MTIHATAINDKRQCLAESQDTGFRTFEEVRATLGEPEKRAGAVLFYEGVMFTRFKWVGPNDVAWHRELQERDQ